jgi:hypothetical protein
VHCKEENSKDFCLRIRPLYTRIAFGQLFRIVSYSFFLPEFNNHPENKCLNADSTHTGDIIVQGDLTNELFDEYRLLVRAIDQVEKHVACRIEIKGPEGIVLVPWLKACALESMRSWAWF